MVILTTDQPLAETAGVSVDTGRKRKIRQLSLAIFSTVLTSREIGGNASTVIP
jgi:hypothetical protein